MNQMDFFSEMPGAAYRIGAELLGWHSEEQTHPGFSNRTRDRAKSAEI